MKKIIAALFAGVCFFISFSATSQSCAPLAVNFSETGTGHVGESQYFTICQPQGWDSTHYQVLSLPDGYRYSQENGCITISGGPTHPGTFTFSVSGVSSNCSDTLSFTKTYVCWPPNFFQDMEPANGPLSAATTTQPYHQTLVMGSISFDVEGFDFNLIAGALPPGLSLTRVDFYTAALSGTPTTAGDYTFTIGSFLGTCQVNSRNYTLHVNAVNPPIVKTLYLNSVCSVSDTLRNWKVTNPNAFPVHITWATVYYHFYTDSLTASPGDTYFTTPNVGGPNTIKITWHDGSGNTKSLVQPSINTLCTPPLCAEVSSVEFYHQGLQKDGNHVATACSDPSSVLGLPDAHDAATGATKAFSLGFDGFIILRLDADITDQPGNDLTVWEYSDGNPSFATYPERAEVSGSVDGIAWVLLGTTSPGPDCNQKLDTQFDLAGKMTTCRYIRILDITDRHAKVLTSSCSPTTTIAFNNAANGFDVDAVTCSQLTSSARKDVTQSGFSSGELPSSVFFPNPASGDVKISLADLPEFAFPQDGIIDISITDMTGTSVYKAQHQLDEQWSARLDVQQLAAGIFVAKIKTASGVRVYKLMKN